MKNIVLRYPKDFNRLHFMQTFNKYEIEALCNAFKVKYTNHLFKIIESGMTMRRIKTITNALEFVDVHFGNNSSNTINYNDLRSYIIENKINQAWISRKLKKNPSWINRILKGNINPNCYSVAKIAEILQIKIIARGEKHENTVHN